MEAPLLARALETAALAHRRQTRQRGKAPYIVHPLRVVGRVLHWGVTDEAVLAAAALHDVAEDTPFGLEEIRTRFGPRVETLVRLLTHDPGLHHDERRRVILEQLAEAPLEAVLVKLADRLDNVHEMQGWRPTSRIGYLGESADIAALARARLGEAEGAMRAALERALEEYDAAVARRLAEARDDLGQATA